jgi:hypothetical protein
MAGYLLDQHQLFGVQWVILTEIIIEKVIFVGRKGGENGNTKSFFIVVWNFEHCNGGTGIDNAG